MRKRGTSVDYGQRPPVMPHGTSVDASGYFVEQILKIEEVPAEWRKHAQEPWRVLSTFWMRSRLRNNLSIVTLQTVTTSERAEGFSWKLGHLYLQL